MGPYNSRPRPKKHYFRQKKCQILAIFGRKLVFFCAGGLATPNTLLQYNSKHVSVGPSPTPAVVNDPTKLSCILSAKNWQFLAIVGRKLIFFCAGGPATPDILPQYNCKHVSVGPSPTTAVVNDPTNRLCILSAKNWQFMAIFGRKLIFVLCWRPCNPRYVAPIQLQTRFSGSVPDPGGRQ